ncbi:MAG: hypothetical protein ACSW8F_04855 [bacterium]
MDDAALERFYRERLEERLITELAHEKGLTLEKAMEVYYSSRLAALIHEGAEGIQYLSPKALTELLLQTEPELFELFIKK